MNDRGHRKYEAEFLRVIQLNSSVRKILARMPQLTCSDPWLVSGALFQTVWNVLDGRVPDAGIRDYDIFYFDPDTSYDAEDRAIQQADEVFADLGAEVELRNQARVHLWYEKKFASAGYPQLRDSTDGLQYFLADACMVAVAPGHDGDLRLFAPAGLADVFNQVVRPNHAIDADGRRGHYEAKAERWKREWPSLTILPWQTD